jgi:predicted nucleic acid-binding protein
MSGLAFFDTNILIYMHDRNAIYKRDVALSLFRRHLYSHTLVISTQVLQEFYVNVSRRTENIRSGYAREITAEYARLNVVSIHPSHVLAAVDLHTRYKLSFWDSLILVAAKAADALLVWSEDLGHGQVYDGVRVENPFLTH